MAEYIGKEYQSLVSLKNLIIYRFKNICLCKGENSTLFRITQNNNAQLNTPSDYSIYGGDYKDINELISAIKAQVEQSIMSHEEEEKRAKEQPRKEFKGVRF